MTKSVLEDGSEIVVLGGIRRAIFIKMGDKIMQALEMIADNKRPTDYFKNLTKVKRYVFVHGQQGSGKGLFGDLIANYLELSFIIDDIGGRFFCRPNGDEYDADKLPENSLIFTVSVDDKDAISIYDLLAEIVVSS